MADNKNYFTLLTDKGKYKIAKATANQGQVKFSHFAIGDGNGQEVNPTPIQTGLVHEVWRAQLDSVKIDPKNPAAVIINAIIPHEVGGWWMREFGLFDTDGDMLAVIKPAPFYKATSAEGQIEDIFYEFQLVLGEQAQVVVLVDPSILWATREFVETRFIPSKQMMNIPFLPVKALDILTPPTSNNSQGDTYVVPQNAKNAWAGKDGQLAEWNGLTWNFMSSKDGHGIGLPDGRLFQKINGQYIEKIALDSQSSKWNYAEAQGSANALNATLTPIPTALITGMALRLKIKQTNTSASTLNLNDFGAKPIIYHETGEPLIGADIRAGDVVGLVYDGESWRLQPSLVYIIEKTKDAKNYLRADNIKVFDVPGTYEWVVPRNVAFVDIDIWGGGGGGGGSYGTSAAAGGGGGGGEPKNGSTGGPSSFGSVLTANGGAGGSAASQNTTNGALGGRISGTAHIAINGGEGGQGSTTNGYVVGGAGGYSYACSCTPLVPAGSGWSGISTGGGGGGGSAGNGGGQGSNGKVILRF